MTKQIRETQKQKKKIIKDKYNIWTKYIIYSHIVNDVI